MKLSEKILAGAYAWDNDQCTKIPIGMEKIGKIGLAANTVAVRSDFELTIIDQNNDVTDYKRHLCAEILTEERNMLTKICANIYQDVKPVNISSTKIRSKIKEVLSNIEKMGHLTSDICDQILSIWKNLEEPYCHKSLCYLIDLLITCFEKCLENQVYESDVVVKCASKTFTEKCSYFCDEFPVQVHLKALEKMSEQICEKIDANIGNCFLVHTMSSCNVGDGVYIIKIVNMTTILQRNNGAVLKKYMMHIEASLC